MRPLNVICFYWNGDRWNANDKLASRYVNNLYRGVARNLTLPFHFVCFSNESLNLDDSIEQRSFESPFTKGVLPRLYMFSEQAGLMGCQVLCLDIDIIITGSLDDIASYRGEFCARSKFAPGQEHKIDGDIIGFHANEENEERFWYKALNNPANVLNLTGGRERYWIRHVVGEQGGDRWNRLYPGQIMSYKRHVRLNNKVPNNARIVSCHGEPRPHVLAKKHQWAKECWK